MKLTFLIPLLLVAQITSAYTGQPCSFNSDCASGKCHISKNICETRGGGFPAGWACDFNSDCQSRQCNMRHEICEAYGGGFPSGWECTFNSDCQSGHCNSHDQCR